MRPKWPETQPSVLVVDGTMSKLLALLATDVWTVVLATRVQYWSKSSQRWFIDYKKILCVITSNRSNEDISLIRIYDSHLKTIHWELNLNELDVHYHTRSTLFHVFTAKPDGHQTGIRFCDPIEAKKFKILVLEASLRRMELLTGLTTLSNLSSRKVINKSLNSSVDHLSSSKPSLHVVNSKTTPHKSMAANISDNIVAKHTMPWMANSKVSSVGGNNGRNRSVPMVGGYQPPLIRLSHKIPGDRHRQMSVTANSCPKSKFDVTDGNANHPVVTLSSYPTLNKILNDSFKRLSQGVRQMDTAINQLKSNVQTVEHLMSAEPKNASTDHSLDVIYNSDEEIITSETPIQTSVDISLNTANDNIGQDLSGQSLNITSVKDIDLTPNSVDEVDVTANQSQPQTQIIGNHVVKEVMDQPVITIVIRKPMAIYLKPKSVSSKFNELPEPVVDIDEDIVEDNSSTNDISEDNEDNVKLITEDLDVSDTDDEEGVYSVKDTKNQDIDNENELKVSESNPMAKHSPKKSNKLIEWLRRLCFMRINLTLTYCENQTDKSVENNESETNEDQSIDNCQQLVDEIQSKMFDFPKQLITKCDEIKPLAANSPDKDFPVFVNCINEMSTKFEDFIVNKTLKNQLPKAIVDIDEDIVEDNCPLNGEKITHFDAYVSEDNDNEDIVKAITEDKDED